MTDHGHSEGKRPKGRGAIPGLLKGLAATARTLAKPTHTAEYPDNQPHLPPRARGVIALLEENCTSCMLCSRECPDWCIYIDSHKETLPATTEGGRERQRNVLDRFAIDFSLCMYCGICIEVCPFDALHWSPEFEYAELDVRDLLHERSKLAQWMPTVPPPPALDPNSAEPAEVTAANKPARTAPADRPARKAPADRPARTAPADRPARTAPADKPAGAAVEDKPAARPAVDKPAAGPAVDKPAGQPAVDKPAGQPAVDKPAGPDTKDKPAGQPAVDKPAGPDTKDKPAGPAAEESP